MRTILVLALSLASVLAFAANELPPFYSLNLIEGHAKLSCSGVGSFVNQGPKVEKNVPLTFECKKNNRLTCVAKFNNKTSKPLEKIYLPLIYSFNDLYLSKDRMGATKTATKVDGGWSMTTPENGNLFVNDAMTELERDQPKKQKLALAKTDNFLFIAAREDTFSEGLLRSTFTYKKTGTLFYPNLLQGNYELTGQGQKFQVGIAVSDCKSEKI